MPEDPKRAVTDTQAIAFDLDMTLVDSRPASQRTLERLVSEHGCRLDIGSLMASYGVPSAQWLPSAAVNTLFRSLQMQDAASAQSMPGAHDAIEAVRRAGRDVVLVTGAPSDIAHEMLRAVGLTVDVVRSDVWGADKVAPLREEKCWAYVGDHAQDMAAARRAGVIAVGVASGLSRPTGAEVELPNLNAFASWLEEQPQP